MPRRSRASETRDASQRPDIESQYQGLLFFPRHLWPKGMTCRWIRVAAGAQPDNARWAQAHLGGWQPLPADKAPQFAIPNPDGSVTPGGIIRIADQILCYKPTADVVRDQKMQERATRAQSEHLDDFVRENPDANIPRFNHSSPTESGIAPANAFKD